METGIRVLLLVPAFALGLQGCGLFGGSKDDKPLGSEGEAAPAEASVTVPAGQAGDASEQPVIDPKVERRQIKTPGIDSADVLVGAYVGVLSIEDFGSSAVIGLRADYHVTEDFFIEASVGR